MVKQQPIHYFVRSGDSDALCLRNAARDNAIVEYVDSDDNLDLAKLAEIVKGKPNCAQKYFIVNKGDVYRAVETDNVENTFVFTGRIKYQIISMLAKGTATLDKFINEVKHLEGMLAKSERQPGFKLHDASGKIISDGETFALQILGDREGEDNNGMDEEMLSKLTEEERLRYGKAWVCVNSFVNNDKDSFICGDVHYVDYFECETIDDIVYLKNNGGYLQFDSDDSSTEIYISTTVPPKDKRVQIHYKNNGDICLTAWGGRIFVECEWVGDGYGAIGLIANDEEELRHRGPMILRIVKH
ncbi:hypothetical protein GGF43_002245 [Coemansia sp. RSA 2618]|nr:hypothetical protein GGF43_002245 [Coemansia sp. RSA 2618]